MTNEDVMSEDEIIEKAEALPDRFADWLTESALWSVKRMRGGGEYGLLALVMAGHHRGQAPSSGQHYVSTIATLDLGLLDRRRRPSLTRKH